MAKQEVRFTDTRRVKELIGLMADNGLTEIELVEDKSRIVLKRGGPVTAQPAATVSVPVAVAAPVAGQAEVPAAPVEKFAEIKSPMVGTFYTAASPEADPYVSVGSAVGDHTVVCIIEAMKVFNEIRAETNGTIVKMLVQNGQSVEFGQPLFLVRPG
jgi:acetyl-CoA carboxylase biotin carboxyl carrier protein